MKNHNTHILGWIASLLLVIVIVLFIVLFMFNVIPKENEEVITALVSIMVGFGGKEAIPVLFGNSAKRIEELEAENAVLENKYDEIRIAYTVLLSEIVDNSKLADKQKENT